MDPTGPTSTPPTGGSAGADRGGPPAFAGVVVGVKREDGAQTLEVHYSQGKLKFKAEGGFQVGDKVRLTFPGQGEVQIEKGPAGMKPAEDWRGAGYTLPRNLDAWKDLRAFEDQIMRWMGTQPQPRGGSAQSQETSARMPLPQLLMQILERKGGKDFLSRILPGLDPAVLPALLDALDKADGEPGAKAALADLLRSPAHPSARSAPGPSRPGQADAFLPAEAGTGHAPWFGRISERREADGILFAAGRMGQAGSARPDTGGPAYRYVLDMGGNTVEAYSAQRREPGEFADFVLERQGGRLQARFSDPAESLPADLRAALSTAGPGPRQGMLLASHYLQEFGREPYFGKLVEDFGAVLAQSGILEPPVPGRAPSVPPQERMDNLLKLFVSFPRDGAEPARQARTWGEAVRDPEALMKLLKTLKPGQDGGLFLPGTDLRFAGPEKPVPGGAPPVMPGPAGEPGGTDGPEAAAAWLRKLLPEAFKADDLLRLAKDASPPAGREHESAKFLLQAVAHSLPQDVPVPEGRPTQFYFYQGQEWRNLQVTWRREGGGGDGRGRPDRSAPLQVKVETESRNMGRVNVGVSWEPKGARLEFRNQKVDARDLLSRSLPGLEKSLAMLDFRIASWSYELLPDDAPLPPAPDRARPAGLDPKPPSDHKGGLDLKG